jgi:hypothetical protein
MSPGRRYRAACPVDGRQEIGDAAMAVCKYVVCGDQIADVDGRDGPRWYSIDTRWQERDIYKCNGSPEGHSPRVPVVIYDVEGQPVMDCGKCKGPAAFMVGGSGRLFSCSGCLPEYVRQISTGTHTD